MIRWFANLPIERKLRAAIMVPAMAAFGIALLMHIATDLFQLREGLLSRASRVARVTGASVIAQIEAGDAASAIRNLKELREEPLVSIAEIFLPNGKKVATYRRGSDDARLEPATGQNSSVTQPAYLRLDPVHEKQRGFPS